MPRWTPPSIAPSLETASSGKKQAASSTSVVPDATQGEGLGGEALSSPSGPLEPAAGTPEGGSEGRGVPRAGPGAVWDPFPLAPRPVLVP